MISTIFIFCLFAVDTRRFNVDTTSFAVLTTCDCGVQGLNRYIRLVDFFHSINCIQPYVLKTLEGNSYDMACFRGYRLFPGLVQVMSVVFWLVSDSSWTVSGGFG